MIGICENCHACYNYENGKLIGNEDKYGEYDGKEWAAILHYNEDEPAGYCIECDDGE